MGGTVIKSEKSFCLPTAIRLVLAKEKAWKLIGGLSLTIIPRVHIGYEMIDRLRSAELAIIISYPTSVSRIVVLLETTKLNISRSC